MGAWSSLEAALTLQSASKVLASTDQLLLPSAGLREGVRLLGDVIVDRVVAQAQVNLPAAAAVLDVIVSSSPWSISASSAELLSSPAAFKPGWVVAICDELVRGDAARMQVSVSSVAQLLAGLLQVSLLKFGTPGSGSRV